MHPDLLTFNVQSIVQSLDHHGVAQVIQWLNLEACSKLTDLVRKLPFKDRTGTYGPRKVVQNFSACEKEFVPYGSPLRDLPLRLTRYFNNRLRDVSPYPFSSRLQFNTFFLLRYPPGNMGLDAHKDHSSNINIIASITLAGSSAFCVHNTVDGPPVMRKSVNAGDIVFIRAPGFKGSNERTVHSVQDVRGERIALIIKQKVR